MANGKIVIDTVLDDSALNDLSNMQTKLNKGGGFIQSAFGGMKNLVGAGLALKGINVAMSAVTQSLDAGIDRFDTMQRFPKMMQQIGYSTTDSTRAINELSDGIEGLPTALNEVTATTQQLALMTGDLDGAVDTTLALNNAFLASGSSSADASRGLTQYTQMLSKGEPDLMSWRTLMETMPVALSMVSEELGYSGDNLYSLYDAMKEGKITFDEFNDALVKVNDQQGGFAEMALENSKGIRTSMQNIKTSFAIGWDTLLKSIDSGMESLGFGGIAESLNNLKYPVREAFQFVSDGVEGIFGVLKKGQPAFKEINRVVKNALVPITNMFKYITRPIADMFDNVGGIFDNFKAGFGEVMTEIGLGNWDRAWERLSNSTKHMFNDLRLEIPKMFEGLQERIFWALDAQSWGEVGSKITQKISSGISTAGDWLGGMFSSGLSFVQDVLINPDSQLNIEAREFHQNVMGLIDGLLEGLEIEQKVTALIDPESEINQEAKLFHDQVMDLLDEALGEPIKELKVQVKLFFEGLWEDFTQGIADAKQKIVEGIQSLEDYGNQFDDPEIQSGVVIDVANLQKQGYSDEEIKDWIDSQYGEGTYETHVKAGVIIEQEIDIQGKYNILKGQGFNEERIKEMIDAEFGGGTYETEVQVEVKPAGFGMSEGVSGQTISGGVSVEVDEVDMSLTENAVNTGVSNISSALNTGADGWNQEVSSAGTRMGESARQGMTMVQRAFASGVISSRNTLQGGVNSWIAVLNSARASAYNSGVNFVNGFRSGMASMLQSVVNTATGIGNAASNALKVSIREASPAKVPMASGRNFTLGYAIGMQKEMSEAEKSARELAERTIGALDSNYSLNGLSYATLTPNVPRNTQTQEQANFNSRLDEVLTVLKSPQTFNIDSYPVGQVMREQTNYNLGQDVLYEGGMAWK